MNVPFELTTDDHLTEWAVSVTASTSEAVPRVGFECARTSWYLAPQGSGRGRNRISLIQEQFVATDMAARLRASWPQDRAGRYVAISVARILSLLDPQAPTKKQLEAMALHRRTQWGARIAREDRLTLWVRAAFPGASDREVAAWTLRPNPDLDGQRPWDLADESENGLTMVLEVLRPLVKDTLTRLAAGFHLEIGAEYTAALLLQSAGIDKPDACMRSGVTVVAHLYRGGTHVGLVSITPEPGLFRPVHPSTSCSIAWLIPDAEVEAADAALDAAAQRYLDVLRGSWHGTHEWSAKSIRFAFLRDVLLMRAVRAY